MSGSLHLFSRKCLSDTRVWINTGCQSLQNNRVRPTALQNCLSLRQLTGFNRWQKGLMCTSCYYEEYCLRTWNVINRHLVASFLFQSHVCGRKKSLPGWLPGTISHSAAQTVRCTHAQWGSCVHMKAIEARGMKVGGGQPQKCSFRWVGLI